MKTIQNLLVALITVGLIAGIKISPVKAHSQLQDLVVNPEAEAYIRTEILADGDADLLTLFPNEEKRVVSADFIIGLWQDPEFQTLPAFKLRNTTILGDIEVEGQALPFNVEFHNCMFTGRINLASAHVKIFRIDDSVVQGSVRMGRMVAEGDVALYGSVFNNEVTLFGADLKSNLFASGSQFNAVEPDPYSAFPFEIWTTQVAGIIEFSDSVFKGEVKSDDAKFGDIRFRGAVFEKSASFRNVQVNNTANFQDVTFDGPANFYNNSVGFDAEFGNATFDDIANFGNFKVGNLADFQGATFDKDVSFESSDMNRDASFTEATFNGNVDFDYLTVTRFFDFDQTTLNNDFSILYSTVGWPYFAESIFNGKVNFEGLQTSNDFDFTSATYNYSDEPFSVQFIKVTGKGIFTNFTAPAGLWLNHDQFGDLTISGTGERKFNTINLGSTKVDGSLDFEGINTDSLYANGLTVAGSSTFTSVNVTQNLDLSNAILGFLTIDQFVWPSNARAINLHGAAYTDITLNGSNRAQDTWKEILEIVDDSVYDAQVYKTFGQFLTDKGNPDLAAEVELARKRRERNENLIRYSGPWIWSWFLDIFAGYGQRPYYALFWSLLIIMVGALVFRKEEDLVILDTGETKPTYNPILYSFALFLPFIDLGIANKWEPKPKRKAAWMYKHIHRLLGWILMPIALLTFSGIIK